MSVATRVSEGRESNGRLETYGDDTNNLEIGEERVRRKVVDHLD